MHAGTVWTLSSWRSPSAGAQSSWVSTCEPNPPLTCVNCYFVSCTFCFSGAPLLGYALHSRSTNSARLNMSCAMALQAHHRPCVLHL